jgi:hypothetical protein
VIGNRTLVVSLGSSPPTHDSDTRTYDLFLYSMLYEKLVCAVLRSCTRIFHPANRNRAAPGRLDNIRNLGRFNGAASPPFGQTLGLRDSGSGPKCPSYHEDLNIDAGMPAIAKERSPANPFIRRIATLSYYRGALVRLPDTLAFVPERFLRRGNGYEFRFVRGADCSLLTGSRLVPLRSPYT